MGKVKISANTFVFPNPVTLLGAMVDDKPNFMALGWISRVNASPPLLGAGVARLHHTARGIVENKAFSINYPTVSMVEKADYCGIVSGKQQDKSQIFEVFYGEQKHAPMIQSCPLNLECKLVHTLKFNTNYLFIGQIVQVFCDQEILLNDAPDIKKLDPLLLTMPDNNYWRVGEHIAKAWKAGKSFKPS